jgi:hypothetical protein
MTSLDAELCSRLHQEQDQISADGVSDAQKPKNPLRVNCVSSDISHTFPLRGQERKFKAILYR